MAALRQLAQESVVAADWVQAHIPYGQRAQLALGVAVASGVLLQALSRACPSYRCLLAVAPLVAANLWLPLIFNNDDEVLSRCVGLLLLSWLGSFKAIGLCLGRGPLVGRWNTAQLVMLYTMPIYPCQDTGAKRKGRLGDNAGSSGQVALSFLGNTTLLMTIAYLLVAVQVPPMVRYYLYFLGLYGFITFVMDGPAALLIGLAGMEVVPPFDKPWLSHSIADFWSRRWNNTVGLTLRALVYDPLVEGRLMSAPRAAAAAGSGGKSGQAAAGAKAAAAAAAAGSGANKGVPLWLRLLGMSATFLVSGLVHEWFLYWLAHRYNPGYWFAFFVVQAPLAVVEGVALTALKRRGSPLPRALGRLYTNVILLSLAALLWFPPIEPPMGDVAPRVVDSVNANVAAIAAALRAAAASAGLALPGGGGGPGWAIGSSAAGAAVSASRWE